MIISGLTRGTRRSSLEGLTSPNILYSAFFAAFDGALTAPTKYTSVYRIDATSRFMSGLNNVVYDINANTGNYVNVCPLLSSAIGYNDTSGNSLPDLTVNLNGFSYYGFDWGAYDEIFNYYMYPSAASATVSFGGLSSGTYDFAFWGIGPNYPALPHFTTITMTGQSKSTVYTTYVSGLYVENKDHVIFRNVLVTGVNATTVATITKPVGSSYSPINGIQLVRKT